ncbi:MAG: tetratricopeptide repeat protein, partial [Acidobacteriota bacterium]
GTFEFDKRRANIGKPDIRHVDMLRQNPMIPLAELFATETHPDYRQGLRARMFDAQSWALVHYLLTTDPARRDKTLRFIDLTLQGVPQDTAFARALDTNYPALQNEVESYIRQFKFGYQRYDLPPIAEETGEAQPLAYSQVLYRLGDLLANQQSLRPEAAEHFRAALQEDPANALALAGLGFLAERQEQWPQAIELYRKAAAQAPDDFLTQYRFGYGLLQQPSTATAAEAKEALRRSVAANPKFAPAWAALNYAYTFDPASSADAIEAGKTAHGLLPSRKDVAQNLLYHFVRAGEREPAKALVDRFFALQGTAAELADARAQVAHLDLKQAWDHLQAEETDDAERIVEAVSATPLGGEGGLRIAQQLRQLRQDIAGQRFFKHLNEAVDRFNAGDFAGAETILEELLAGDPQIHGAEQARELLAAVKEQLGRNDG